MPTTPANVIAAWQKRANWLAQWSVLRLVNRSDQWIRFLSVKKRTTDPDGKAHLARQAPLPPKRGKLRLTEHTLVKHFRGESPGDLIGVHSASGDNTTKWIAIDMESRHGPSDAAANLKAAHHWDSALHSMGFRPLLIDADGEGGYQILILFRSPLAAGVAHDFGAMIVSDYATFGLAQPPRIVPRGPTFDPDDWLRVPGRHPITDHWTRVWKMRRWIEGADAADALLHAHGDSIALIQKLEIPATIVAPQPQPVAIPLVAPPRAVVAPPDNEPTPHHDRKKRRGSDRAKTETQILCYLLASTRGDYELGAFSTLEEHSISQHHFSTPIHREILQAMRKLHDKQERITPSCIAEEIAAEHRKEALAVLDRLMLQKRPTADAFEELLNTLAESPKSHNGDGVQEAVADVLPPVLAVDVQPPPVLVTPAPNSNGDSDLQSLIEAWPMLTPAVRQEVLAVAMVKPIDVSHPA